MVALVGYTNAGKSTVMNRLSRAGVLAENMLFATLDPTTRRVQLPRKIKNKVDDESIVASSTLEGKKGPEILLTDTVGFISKLPTNLIAAFRATLEEVTMADVLVLVCDRSNPVWEKQKSTVMKELAELGCNQTPIVELWNKIDSMPNPEDIQLEAATIPIDVDAFIANNADIDDAYLTQTSSSIAAAYNRNSDENKNDDDDDGNNNKDESFEYDWSEDEEFIRAPAPLIAAKKNTNSKGDGRIQVISTAGKRKHYVVAASAKTGLGMDDFVETLSDALNLFLSSVTLMVPYAKDDGIIDQIHQQGVVERIEYQELGTYIECRIPEVLTHRIMPFKVNSPSH